MYVLKMQYFSRDVCTWMGFVNTIFETSFVHRLIESNITLTDFYNILLVYVRNEVIYTILCSLGLTLYTFNWNIIYFPISLFYLSYDFSWSSTRSVFHQYKALIHYQKGNRVRNLHCSELFPHCLCCQCYDNYLWF